MKPQSMGIIALLVSSGCALVDSRERFVRFEGYVVDKEQNLAFVSPIDETQRTFTDAGTYCAGLSLGAVADWRLPTSDEMLATGDEDAQTGEDPPFVDVDAFPRTPCGPFWTGSEWNAGNHVVVDFCKTLTGNSLADTTLGWVRCVSELAASQADL